MPETSMHTFTRPHLRLGLVLLAAVGVLTVALGAQDRLKTMPGYERYLKMQPQIQGAVVSGALNVTWKDDGKTFEYTKDGKIWVYDVTTGQTTATGDAPAAP